MEYYQRDIILKFTTGSTTNTYTGRTENGDVIEFEGTMYTIAPDETVIYNLKLFLNSDFNDVGIMENTDVEDNESEVDDVEPYIVSGTSESRLYELEKYGFNNSFTEKYIGNGNVNIDGVDYNNSVENSIIIYYLSGIKYTDDIENNITYYSFTSNNYEDNFINNYYVKLPYLDKYNEILIEDDIFIDRQNISAFYDNNQLEFLDNLVKVNTYAGGRYFNIINNK
ncbi:MAG: hypothetical protein ACOCVF_00320 [bacterium]